MKCFMYPPSLSTQTQLASSPLSLYVLEAPKVAQPLAIEGCTGGHLTTEIEVDDLVGVIHFEVQRA